MGAFGDRLDGDQPGFQPDPLSALAIVHEPDDRRAADNFLRVNPVERAADHFCVALGQIAGGEPRFAAGFAIVFVRFEPLSQRRWAFAAIGNLGHVEWHGRYVWGSCAGVNGLGIFPSCWL
jgi:hypothetical protein